MSPSCMFSLHGFGCSNILCFLITIINFLNQNDNLVMNTSYLFVNISPWSCTNDQLLQPFYHTPFSSDTWYNIKYPYLHHCNLAYPILGLHVLHHLRYLQANLWCSSCIIFSSECCLNYKNLCFPFSLKSPACIISPSWNNISSFNTTFFSSSYAPTNTCLNK
jgi:hypothetical protein